MILLIGGTADGRKLAEFLAARGYAVTVSVTTALGARLLRDAKVKAVQEKFTAKSLGRFLQVNGIEALVDASHPFAAEISRLAQDVCELAGVPYLRYERPRARLPRHPLINLVDSWEEAANAAGETPGAVFLTVGVKPLARLYRAGLMRSKKVVARVLPEESSIAACKKFGVDEIVAFRGVASKELNMALFKQFTVGTVITKDSGETGGTETKIQAALAMNLPVIVLKRPRLNYQCKVMTFAEVEQFLKERDLS